MRNIRSTFSDYHYTLLTAFVKCMIGQHGEDVVEGLEVDVIQKEDQRTGKLTRGIVQEILTSSPTHPHGIKVRLQSGAVGRVQRVHPRS